MASQPESAADTGGRKARRSLVAAALGSLRGRVIVLTIGFILFAEVLIYPPSAASFRDQWLHERAQAGEIASLAVSAAPGGDVGDELSLKLRTLAQVLLVAVEREDVRELALTPSEPMRGPILEINLKDASAAGLGQVFAHLFSPSDRLLLIRFKPIADPARQMEVVVPEAALKQALWVYSGGFLAVSLLIAAVAGALMYLAIYRLVVKPIERLTKQVVRFAEAPETPVEEAAPAPTQSVEMTRAFDALRHMQQQVSASFRQRKRLADLGEAMAKINHDLRNSLSAAQIVSEGLAESDDPRVKRAAPRLERALERAVNLAEATLRYGRAEPARMQLQSAPVKPILSEAAAEALAAHPGIELVESGEDLSAVFDAEHLHRIVANLVRNAARALAEQQGRTSPGRIAISVAREGAMTVVTVADNGPGVPPRVQETLFRPFSGSATREGAGLGLAIARELARSMGGDLELAQSGTGGATFVLKVPAV